MTSFRDRRRRKRNDASVPSSERPEPSVPAEPAHTGSETTYLRALVDSRKTVTVVFTTGATLRGRIRYFDRDCLSIGPVGPGPNIFLRKSSVGYIAEELSTSPGSDRQPD